MEEPYLSAIERLMKEGFVREELRNAPATADPTAALVTPSWPPLRAKPVAHREYLAGLGWPAVIILCLIPGCLMLLDFRNLYHIASLANVLLAIGDYTGVVGLALYVTNLILTTRWRFIETMFGGLNRVFMAHGILGGLAMILILMHPIITALSYYSFGIRVVASFLTPRLSDAGTLFGMAALLLMAGLIIASIYIKLGYRVWLRTHRFLGLAYLLIAVHVILIPNKITADPFLHVYLWILLDIGAGAYLYRSLLPNIFVRRYLYTIKSAIPKEVGTIEVTLSPLDAQIRFRPGQFIFIAFDSDGLSAEWHPFSISSAAFSNELRIDVKSLGTYTETLTRLLPFMVGMTVHVEGAYGRFSYQNARNENQVWIAGGIGITPFLSMAQTLGTGNYNIDLYYSVRHQSELIDLETLVALQSVRPGQTLRVFPFVGDTYNIRLSGDIIAANTDDIASRDFLLCGPPAMMHAIAKQLIELGVPRRHIHSEEFALK